MKNTSPPIFDVRPDALPEWATEVSRLVGRVAEETGVQHLLVGAIARDLVLHGVFGLAEGRQTLDLDFGFAVRGWPQFDDLKAALLRSGKFRLHGRIPHRLFYRGAAAEHVVDVIPFGGVEEQGAMIAWPPSRETVMNVAGFRDALSSAIVIRIGGDLTIPVASIPGMAIMKLLAWAERGEANNRDAGDLHRLLSNYAHAGNEERLFADELTMVEEAGFDLELAGARLLGKDAAATASQETAARMASMLDSEGRLDRLVTHMVLATPSLDENHPQRCLDLVSAFRTGFRARLAR